MDGIFAAFITKLKEFFGIQKTKKLLAASLILLGVFAGVMVHLLYNQPFSDYSKSGFTYEVFQENSRPKTTEMDRKHYKLLDLQERLAASIALFNGVQDAKVTIVLGEDKKDGSDSQTDAEATASVVVTMKDGGSPTEQQVESIQRLVSKSTPDIKFENVIVTDGSDVSMLVQ